MPPAKIDRQIEITAATVESDLRDRLPAEKLRAIRDLFDDASLADQLKDLLVRRDNDPQRYEIPNTVMRIMRRVEELRDARERDREMIRTTSFGAGTGLVVGSLVACLNPVIGLIALVPALCGLFVGATSYLGVRRSDQERTLYRQIADRLAVISKALEWKTPSQAMQSLSSG